MTNSQRNREYYQKNKEKLQLKQRLWYQNHKEAKKQYDKEHNDRHILTQKTCRDKLKLEVITYYGGDKAACLVCGENRLPCLSIDHLNGGGNSHRKLLGTKAGYHFYRWLRRQGYPEGYQTLCMNCQCIKRHTNKEWGRNNA